jgi:hypothetical protein
VTLQNPRGRECTSRLNGAIEYCYQILARGVPSLVYLPLEAVTQIDRLQVQGGDQIEILKSKRQGRESFEIRLLPDASEPPENGNGTRVLAPRPVYAQTMRQPIGQAHHQAGAAQHQAPATSPVLDDVGNPGPEGVLPGNTALQRCVQTVLMHCLEVAAGATWGAYQKALAAGVQIEAPLWDDVRATANTLFIALNDSGVLDLNQLGEKL